MHRLDAFGTDRFQRLELVSPLADWAHVRQAASTQFPSALHVIINCTGLGARQLFNDQSMYAVRGQTLRVRNPLQTRRGLVRLDRYLQCDGDPDSDRGEFTYIFPHDEYIVLGGVGQPANEDMLANATTTQSILARCARLWPDLQCLIDDPACFRANSLGTRVGLRPARRGGVRLEVDAALSTPHVALLHNYGHAGEGVTLSWVRCRIFSTWRCSSHLCLAGAGFSSLSPS
jgi:D-amino-acid oxidase